MNSSFKKRIKKISYDHVFYYRYSVKLSQSEKLLIGKKVSGNHAGVSKFVKKIYDKGKVILIG